MNLTSTILAVLAFSLACTREKAEEPSEYRGAEIAEKKAFYCEQAKSQYEARKWMVGRCDGLLFTSLWSVACAHGDVASFEDTAKPGYWHRNPDRDCYLAGAPNPDNGAKASISRDMLLGLMLYACRKEDAGIIDRLISYGEAHTWIMGDAIDARTLISRVVMTPELVDLAYSLQQKLSLVQQDPQSDDAFYINKGFQAHLDVIKIILTGCARGTVSAIQASILKAQANRQPSNALYVAAASRYGKANPEDAADFLLDSHHFPSSRLPSKAEHCEPYLFQRDANSADWEPCGTAEELHDGTDFVVAASILDGSL